MARLNVAWCCALLLSGQLAASFADTCESGNVGDGQCSDPNLCCSEWGWCETRCSVPSISSAPTLSPVDKSLPSFEEANSRLVAFLGNWQSCPSAAQVVPYTHIVIAFAVSYAWNPGKNACSQTCEISDPAVCDNNSNPIIISQWQAAGKKVLLSFGGSGMGTISETDVNDCWEYCYGRETQVIDRLVEISNNLGLDGIDIDFEYHVTDEAAKFLNEVTVGLKNALPEGSLVTHVPMDADTAPGLPYYDKVLKVSGSALDFLMPQYYNGYTRPAIDGIDGTGEGMRISALSHYQDIVDGIYGGDSTRVVFGFCISDCLASGSNVNGAKASTLMTDLAKTYPCNGGAFFWVALHDTGGSWSSSVSSTIKSLASSGCSSEPPSKSPSISSPSAFEGLSPIYVPEVSPSVTIDTPQPVAPPSIPSVASGSNPRMPFCIPFYLCVAFLLVIV